THGSCPPGGVGVVEAPGMSSIDQLIALSDGRFPGMPANTGAAPGGRESGGSRSTTISREWCGLARYLVTREATRRSAFLASRITVTADDPNMAAISRPTTMSGHPERVTATAPAAIITA